MIWRKNHEKITKKINIALVCTALLGGVVLPATSVFNTAIVYAETHVNTSNQPIVVVVYYHGQNLDGTTVNLTERGEFVEFQPGQEIAAPKEFEGYTLTETTYIPPAFSEGILMYVYTQNKPVEQPKDSAQTVSYTVQMIDQDNKVLQSEVRTGIEGVGATISIPKLEGYLFRGYQIPTGSDFSGKQTEISFLIQKDAVITLRYQFTPPIDEIISPEKRAEYQAVYDEFHRIILEAYAVYKQELGTDGIAYDKVENLSDDLLAIHGKLVIDTKLLDTPLETVLSDDYFINGLAWTEDYWNYHMEQLKENTQTLKTALANIAKVKIDVNNSNNTNTDTNTDIHTNIGGTQAENGQENGQENDKQTDTNNFGVTTNKQDINSNSTNTITQPAPQQSSIAENISSDKNQKADIKELPETNSTKSNILSFVGVGILGMTAFIKRYAKRQSR